MNIEIKERDCPTCAGVGKVPDVTGATLREIRCAMKTADGVSPLPQAAVARAMGITPSHLNDIELGRRRQGGADAEAEQQARWTTIVDGFLKAVQAVAATASPRERRPQRDAG